MIRNPFLFIFAIAFWASLTSAPCAEPADKPPDWSPETLFQQKPPMNVTIVRDAEPGCEPDCTEWISAEGIITPETPQLFEKILNDAGTRKLPILINSPGGAVDASITIGRMIRSRQLDIAVSKTDFKPCKGAPAKCAKPNGVYGIPHSNGAICASACTFILASGSHRYVAPWSHVGVHQATSFEKRIRRTLRFKPASALVPGATPFTGKLSVEEKDETKVIKLDAPKPEVLKAIDDYLETMGITSQLQTLAQATKADSLHWLTMPELAETHIASDYRSGEYLALSAAGTKPEVSNADALFSHAIVAMPSFTGRPALVLLEFYRWTDDSDVQVFASLGNRADFVDTATFTLALEFGPTASKLRIDAISAKPHAPMHGAIPVAKFCTASTLGNDMKLTLIQVTKDVRLAGRTSPVNLRQLSGMNELLAALCKA